MKTILVGVALLLLAAAPAPAQETATQQQIDQLSAQIQEMQEVLNKQDKRIDALEKGISELRDKVNTPVVNDYASRDDVRKLADQVQEVDRKRKEDSEMIANKLDGLIKTVAATPTPVPPVRTQHVTPPKILEPANPDKAAVTETGHEYVIQQGDTLGLIAKAYRDKGVKVTRAEIIAANPKMNPNVLIPGKKLFIPDPAAK